MPGSAQRSYQKELNDLLSKINKIVKEIEFLIFAKDENECKNEIIRLFKEYYELDYLFIAEFCDDTKERNKINNRYKEFDSNELILSSPEVKKIIGKVRRGEFVSNNCLSIDLKEAFIQKRSEVNRKRSEKYKSLYLQRIDPLHFNKMIVFYDKAVKSGNAKLRDLVIDEFFKYDGTKVVKFLKKLNNVRENFSLKYRVVTHLSETNHHARLTPKKEGKKTERINSTEKYDPSKELMNSVYERISNDDDFEMSKEYDCFISHSKLDFDKTWEVIESLNKEGKSCYFCWTSDHKEGIVPQEHLKEILKLRINQSKEFVIINSPNYNNSYYCKFEKEYAEKAGKKIRQY